MRDYILSNGYADKDVDEIPTYDEIVGGSDDDFEQQQTEFEHKYNFRFEEPDKDFIKRYPRTIDQSVRKTDDRRKVKRVEVRERKHKEKEEKLKEIEILKEFKRKEIEEKMQKLKAVIGDEEMNLEDIDLDEDFDPEAHDKRMQTIFNNEYYEIDEGEEKPEVPSDIEDLQVENYDDYEPEQADEDVHCEDDAFNMDCEYDAATQRKSLQEELIESTRDKRKRRKRKSKFMEMLERDRPKFNPEYEKTYGEYLDEYYKLDCEDVIGDTQCRFKYVETTPNDFGLSIEEVSCSAFEAIQIDNLSDIAFHRFYWLKIKNWMPGPVWRKLPKSGQNTLIAMNRRHSEGKHATKQWNGRYCKVFMKCKLQ